MAQADYGNPVSPLSGSALNTLIKNWRDALHSTHKGSSQPSYRVAGKIWVDDTTTSWILKFYDGADWITLGTVNASTNIFNPAGYAILDEDNMASNSATAIPTQQSVKAYVDASSGSLTSYNSVLASNVSLNNTGTFFDGPSTAQGTTGTFLVMASATCRDTSGTANFIDKITDGTTVVSSGQNESRAANAVTNISLSGIITNPAANLKLQVKDVSSTNGQLLSNITTEGKDTSITVVRIA